MTRLLVLATAALLCGCAKSPDQIVAAPVATTGYEALSCEQLAAERDRIARDLQHYSAVQRQAQADDAAGVFLVGLPVGSMTGGSQEATIARLKGEQVAVGQVATAKRC